MSIFVDPLLYISVRRESR